jgi:hypothetical protein
LVAEIRPTYVGADTSMSTAPPTTAGTPVMGINHDGVGFLNSNCTASLLWTGQHVLTAAHCVNSLAAGSIRFDLSSGPLTYTYGAGDAQRHPSYSGMVENGYDVAVIKLGTVVDVTVPRYDIFTLTDQSEIGVTSVKFGYGLTGNGNTGSEGSRGTKHYGVNEWESLGLGDLGVPGTTNDSTQLTYDFDNGLAANDGFGYFFGSGAGAAGNPIYDDTGLGLDETMSAGGDSGSPTFVLDGGTYKIAGVGSYISRLADSGGNSSDIDLLNN